jgi:CRISPR-associated endoribonuclease Cas6
MATNNANPRAVDATPSISQWQAGAELIKLVFEMQSLTERRLSPNYAVGLHAWFLDQIRQFDPELSALLHDGGSEKPFTVSDLEGSLPVQGRQVVVLANKIYRWSVSALSQRVGNAFAVWLKRLPTVLDLRDVRFTIKAVQLSENATTYAALLTQEYPNAPVAFSFLTATSFRRKGHHLPLPWPTNVYGSYLRRWNDFSGLPIDQETFLAWIDESVIIRRHRLETVKVTGGKAGSVTGFLGAVEFGISKEGQENRQFTQYFYALSALAPYCGTGHKTTHGLGQTVTGWQGQDIAPPVPHVQLAERIAGLSEIFISQRKRTGGDRAKQTAETWATILARREFGESLQVIAADMELPYETVKTYVKLARRSLKPGNTID